MDLVVDATGDLGGGLGRREKLRHWVDCWLSIGHDMDKIQVLAKQMYTITIQLCYWDDRNPNP